MRDGVLWERERCWLGRCRVQGDCGFWLCIAMLI